MPADKKENITYCKKCKAKKVNSILFKGVLVVGNIELQCRKCKTLTNIIAG